LYYDSDGYVDHWDKTPATVYSIYDGVTDDYGPAQGTWYPHELGIPVTIGTDSEIIVEVFVPVMDAIASGSGTQLARLRIDWSGVETVDTNYADTDALGTAIRAIPANFGTYTDESYAALTASATAGTYLIDSNDTLTVTNAIVNARTAAISAAQTALIDLSSTIDRTVLTALYNKAAELAPGAYTTTSYNALHTAIGNAYAVLADTASTQEDVDAQIPLLQAAIDGLVDRADVSALTALISTAKTDYKAADYTSSSYTELLTAIATAEEVRDGGDATQEQVNAEVEALQEAIDALKTNPPVEVKPEVITDDSGAATATVDETDLTDALDKLTSDSGDPELSKYDTLTIKLEVTTDTGATDDKILLTLSNSAATALAAAANDNNTANIELVVETDVANITLDNAAIIAAFGNVATGEDVVITIESASETELTAVQETAIAGKTAITVEFTAGGEKVHISGITVTAPYSSPADSALKVWRLKSDGTLELADNAPKFENGNIIFTVTQ
jgi:cyclophilin family peptidyl-prolyl cis-trans isomerase